MLHHSVETEASIYPSNTYPATFVAGSTGPWRIERVQTISGEGLPSAERLEILDSHSLSSACAWSLRGVASHARYVQRSEKVLLDGTSPPLGRAEATRAALIPIRKTAAWWALPQDERRNIFEERSGHISDTLKYLPRIARRLYHARDLGEEFDFLTWFEFAPEHASAFDELVAVLRDREEWTFVEREVDVRLTR